MGRKYTEPRQLIECATKAAITVDSWSLIS